MGLLPSRCPRTTRKKSPPVPTAPCAPRRAHRRRSDDSCGTKPPNERRPVPVSSGDAQTKCAARTGLTALVWSDVAPNARPLPPCLEPKMPPDLLEGHFQPPVHNKPTEDLLWIGLKVRTQKGLGFGLAFGIAHQNPAQGYGEQASAVPN